MIIYSVIPQELMFPPEYDFSAQSVVEIDGIPMLVEQVSGAQCKVIRLLSSDPNDYLNAAYSPGQLLPFTPNI